MTPSGIICIWNKPIADIPAGWLLCDGTNGTPDLRGIAEVTPNISVKVKKVF